MTTPASPLRQAARAPVTPHGFMCQISSQRRRGKRQQLSIKKQMAGPLIRPAVGASCHQPTAI